MSGRNIVLGEGAGFLERCVGPRVGCLERTPFPRPRPTKGQHL